jgi:hypothetical protein
LPVSTDRVDDVWGLRRSTWPRPRTTPSGPGPSSKHSATLGSAPRNCSRSPTSHWSPTAYPTPAKSSPCYRSCHRRATRNACCWSAPSLPASSPRSSSDSATPTTAPSHSNPATTRRRRRPARHCRTCFNARSGWRSSVISATQVKRLLTEAIARAGLRDVTGQPLHYTPHDFRRLFTTEAVTGGLPVHIAAKLLGHHNIATVESYLAVFQDELIRTYRAFLDKRRAARPESDAG